MRILHATWTAGQVGFWAEEAGAVGGDAVAAPAPRARRRGRVHPFAAGPAGIAAAARALGAGRWWAQAREERLELRLPSEGSEPLPSPRFAPFRPRAGHALAAPVLATWEVPAARIPWRHAVAFLAGVRPSFDASALAQPGETLRFWSEASRFVLEILARQQIAALLEEREGAFRATWRPLLRSPRVAERLAYLAARMPPACSADTGASGHGAEAVLRAFLEHAVDAIVREQGGSGEQPARAGRPGPRRTGAAEAWLAALQSPPAPVAGAPRGLSRLASEVSAWTSTLEPSAEEAFRTCFRLEPPPARPSPSAAPDESTPAKRRRGREPGTQDARNDRDLESWSLTFHFQARDDPSLLVSAEAVWAERPGALLGRERSFRGAQERILADLGRACRVVPALERGLRVARPSGCPLTADEAFTFLRTSVPVLEEMGYGVLVPAWWTSPSSRPRLRLTLEPRAAKKGAAAGASVLGLDAIATFRWEVALGDEVLSRAEFEEIARLKVPLVRVRGEWRILDSGDVDRALRAFAEAGSEGTIRDALRLAAGAGPAERPLPPADVQGIGAMGDLLACLRDDERVAPVAPPRALRAQLRPYQARGLAWLAFHDRHGTGACLADDMGLGKTIQLIALLAHEREGGSGAAGVGPTLVVSPMSIVGNWQREIARFAPGLRVLVHHGDDRRGGAELARDASAHDVVLTTYGLVQRDAEGLGAVEWHRVVLDEAQNVKNAEAKQSRAVRALRARRRIALTGTPVENRLSDLWSIFEFLNPGLLGGAAAFRRSFATPIERDRDPQRGEDLRRLVRPFVLRRLKTDKSIIDDLPEKLERQVVVNLTREQATLYEAVVREMMAAIEGAEGIGRRGLVLATLLKLKQVCDHPALFLKEPRAEAGRSGKLARLTEMLDEVVPQGDRALVFTQFSTMGGMLAQHLVRALGRDVLLLTGDTAKKERDALVRRFQDEPDGPPVLVLSVKAGGTGLNLTRANHVFHFDRWWNPAVENQATDRAYRIGQRKDVQVHKLVCAGTVEERIAELIGDKKALAERVVGTGEGWITELSTRELRRLFALSGDAVVEG